MTDTPDIVERLMAGALPWIDVAFAKPTDPEETPFYFTRYNMEVACRWGIETALRAQPLAAYPDYLAAGAQPAPQARDEGGAVAGWVMLPADPGPCELDESGWLLEFVRALHVYIPEAMQPVSWSDFTDGQRSRLKTAYRAMLDARPSPPTDAINTAEGEAWLAQKEQPNADPELQQTDRGLHAGRAGQTGVALGDDAREEDIPRSTTEAAALTPRELTDEEAERGARAYCEALRQEAVMLVDEPDDYQPFAGGYDGLDEVQRGFLLNALRAAYRAITEEPAR